MTTSQVGLKQCVSFRASTESPARTVERGPMNQRVEMAQVMGILNVTPDSFSDGGQHLDHNSAVARGLEMVAQGASVIDIGGESTRPGALPVDPSAEQARVVPVIERLVAELRTSGARGSDGAGVRISVDTRNAETAAAAVAAGADLINDVSAALWPVAADLGVGWVAMHMLGDPRTMQASPTYEDVVAEVTEFLVDRARSAADARVSEIWIDPGIGFGKTTRHNLELLARLDELVATGYPVLIGTSSKTFLGELTARSDRGRSGRQVDDGSGAHQGDSTAPTLTDVTDRLEGSVATAVWAVTKGVRMVRVHDVSVTSEAVEVVQGNIPDR